MWCRMGDAVEFIGGSQPPKSVFSFSATADSIRLIQIRDYKSDKYMTFIPKSQAKRFCSADDIMIGRYGPPIFQILRGLEGAYNVALMKAVPCNAITKNYLYYMLKDGSLLSMIESLSDRTCGQDGVNMYDLKRYIIAIPPLAEQQRIVEQIETLLGYVDIIDTDAETLEKSITLAKQKILDLAIRGKLVPQDPTDEPASELLKKIKAEKEALIKAGKIKKDKHESYIFKGDDNCYYEQLNGKNVDITAEIPFELPESWCWCRLRSLGQIVGGGTPSTTNQMFWNGSIPWLSPADLTGYTEMYIAHGKKNITEEGLEKSSAALMPAGSILYSSRAPIGYVVISTNPISTNQGFKSLVPAIAGMSEFYYFVLKARTSDIKQRATGTTFKEISGNDFGNTLVPLPPITEQKRIVQAIAQYNSILELISK